MQRNVLLSGVVVVVAAAAGVGWFFGSQIRSPAEAAADAEAPEPSNITVEVVRQALSADVVTRGDIVFDDPIQVGLSGSFAEQPESLVVTQAVEVDSQLAEGEMAVEVVGRPVFLLTGEIPMYRDLRPGSSGDDVHQVEEALARMGYLTDEPDDTWDDATGAAVSEWYEEMGYLPNGLSDEDEDALSAARDRVRGAETVVADAEAGLADAQRGTGQSAVASAQAEVDSAKDALELAQIDADRANEQAADAVTDAETAIQDGDTRLAAAQTDLADGEAADPPLEKEDMDALRQAVTDVEAGLSAAVDALDDAEFQQGRTAVEQDALVESARSRVTVAEAALADASRGMDTSALRSQIDSARAELTSARDDLGELEADLGTWLPAGEVVFLPRLPVRVDQVATSRGSVIDASFVTVSGSEVALRSSVTERDAPQIAEGMEVEIENPETGGTIDGVISSMAGDTGTNGVSDDRYYIEIEPAELPEEIIGENVRITIPVSSTGGEVLAVPAAALSARADGSTIVEVEDDDGRLTRLEVETGLAAEGLVEVTPVDGELEEGDLVVVGREDGETPGADADADDDDEVEDDDEEVGAA